MSRPKPMKAAVSLAELALSIALAGALLLGDVNIRPVFANGGGGGGSSGGGGGAGGGNGVMRGFSPDVCPQGYVLDQRRRVCVRAHAGVLPDEDLYQQGRA